MHAQTAYTKAAFNSENNKQARVRAHVESTIQRAKETVLALPKPLRDLAAIEFVESCSFPRQANLLAMGLEEIVTRLKAITSECEFAEELELTLQDEEKVRDNKQAN